jgi:hypothetical protein
VFNPKYSMHAENGGNGVRRNPNFIELTANKIANFVTDPEVLRDPEVLYN